MGFSTLSNFPTFPGLALPILRKPVWRTTVQESVAGAETALQLWTYPRYEYNVDLNFLRQASSYGELQSLLNFYHSIGARGRAFQYLDPNDHVHSTSTAQTVAIGDGVTTSFQVIRNYGGFVEPVFAVSTITAIAVDSTIITSTQYAISGAGLLSFSTFTVPAAQTITWAGTFNWLCRFMIDTLDLSQFTNSSDRQGPLWEVKGLQFITIKFGA